MHLKEIATRSHSIVPLFWFQCMENKSRTQLFPPKSSVIIFWTVSLSMWNHSDNIRIVECWSSAKAEDTYAICSDVQMAWGHPALRSSSTLSQPLQNLLYHSKTFVWDRHSLPNAFCNILYVSLAVNSFLKQNLITVHCSRCLSMTTGERIWKHSLTIRCLIVQYWNLVFSFGRLWSTCSCLSRIDSATRTILTKSVMKLYSHTLYKWFTHRHT